MSQGTTRRSEDALPKPTTKIRIFGGELDEVEEEGVVSSVEGEDEDVEVAGVGGSEDMLGWAGAGWLIGLWEEKEGGRKRGESGVKSQKTLILRLEGGVSM